MNILKEMNISQKQTSDRYREKIANKKMKAIITISILRQRAGKAQ